MKKVLVGSFLAVLVFSGCTEEAKEEKVQNSVEKSQVETKVAQEDTTNKNIELIKEKSNEILDSSKEIVKAVSEESEKISKEVMEKAKVASVEVAKEAKEITKAVSEDLNKSLDSVINSKETASNVDVSKLYAKCAGCHGQNGELKALGKSQIIKGWSEEKIKESLIGYKNGTYGGNMKGIMIGQVTNLTNEEINALAKHISQL